MKKVLLFLVISTLIIAWGYAKENVPMAKSIEFESFWKYEGELVIDCESKAEIKFPAIKKIEGKVPFIRFKGFLKIDRPGGWGLYMLVDLNGKVLNKYTDDGRGRLLNRIELLNTTLGEKEWFSPDGKILTFFSPEDVMDDRVINYREEMQWYLLNISDYVNYIIIGADERIEKEEENKLTFTNTLRSAWVSGKNVPLVIKELEIGYIDSKIVDNLSKKKAEKYPEVKGAFSIPFDKYELKVDTNGGIELNIEGEKYYISSYFSYPGKKIGYNSFSIDINGSEESWQPKGEKTEQGILIKAEGENYEIERVIKIEKGKIKVEDNISFKQECGTIITHKIVTSQPPGQLRICGVETDNAVGIAENPTIFISQNKSSCGILFEDNISRLQGEVKSEKSNLFSWNIKHFGMEKGKKYKFEFSIYPQKVPSSYWTFINRVRNEWGVNQTVEGPFAFSSKYIPERKIKIYAISAFLDFWVESTTKLPYSGERYKKRVKEIMEKIKEVQPDALCLGQVETNLVPFCIGNIEGKEIFPKPKRGTGQYGFILDKKQSQLLEKHIEEKWKDSILRTEDGRIIVDTYYPGFLDFDTPEYLNLLVYLEEGNGRYNHFIKQIDFIMDECGLDGLYIDQFSLCWGGIGAPDRHTYEKWDGYTVDIDEKTGKIVRKYTDCGLIGIRARKKILEYILSKKGIVVVNGFPGTKEEQNFPKVFRFAEFENQNLSLEGYLYKKPPYNIWCAKGHLSTPITLGVRPSKSKQGEKLWAEMIMKAVITGLRNGVLYYYHAPGEIPKDKGEYGPINHMFPFTPVEINEGYLIGKERIITCISGVFKFHKEPKIYYFDLKGREKQGQFKVEKEGENWKIDVKIDDWNEIVVIE